MMEKRSGFVTVFLVVVIIILGIILTGTYKRSYQIKTALPDSGRVGTSLSCCDTGSGDACRVQTGPGQTLTYNGTEYGLLKKSIQMVEGNCHLKDTGQLAPDGGPIILNDTAEYSAATGLSYECGKGILDQVRDKDGNCTTIPNDIILYVCREDCGPGDVVDCDPGVPRQSLNVYGKKDSVYDVYLRTADQENIPGVIKACDIASYQKQNTSKSVAPGSGTASKKENLQIGTFNFLSTVGWLAPWCKPAVYLYPESTTPVSVKVASSQPITYSDPVYPTNGWNVIANPDGSILYEGKILDYLYYETNVEDSLLNKPKTGYVVARGELDNLFDNILPKLGLNKKESEQFSEYWVKTLPDSAYYFIGVVPTSYLSKFSNLRILPSPTTSIRVTLYFEPLKEFRSVTPPTIVTPQRHGFTVVEWGGIFKRQPNSKFSCVM